MRNMIFGGIGVVWGGGIILYSVLGAPRAGGAYGAGQMVGTVFGILLFVVGFYYLIAGVREMNQGERSSKRKKRKRRRRDDEDE
jgi:hypothetical protein